jgi:hypothetical protein
MDSRGTVSGTLFVILEVPASNPDPVSKVNENYHGCEIMGETS